MVHQRSPPIRAKVVVVGDTGVGKTSVILRYDGKGFSTKVAPTLGASFISSTVKVEDQEVVLQLWDTAGQERFRSMVRSCSYDLNVVPMYLRNAVGALAIFDMTSAESFEGLKFWINEVSRAVPDRSLVFVVIANKCDLTKQRMVDKEEGVHFADSINAAYFETSALNGQGYS